MLVMDSLESLHLSTFFRLVKRRAAEWVVSHGHAMRMESGSCLSIFGNFGNSGDFGNLFLFRRFWQSQGLCLPLDKLFRLPHLPIEAFVANKSQSDIRKACQRPVEAHFSLRSALESGSIFLAVRIGKFIL